MENLLRYCHADVCGVLVPVKHGADRFCCSPTVIFIFGFLTMWSSFKEGLDLGWIKEVLAPLRVRDGTLDNTRAGEFGHGVGFPWLSVLRRGATLNKTSVTWRAFPFRERPFRFVARCSLR
jgi:hypothetical protein